MENKNNLFRRIFVISAIIILLISLIGISYVAYKRSTNVAKGIYIPQSIEKPNSKYSLYFGVTHSHTHDGKEGMFDIGRGTFEESIDYAKDKSNLDFFVLSPHASSVSEKSFNRMRNIAIEKSIEGEFVVLAGQEADTGTVMLNKPSEKGVPGGAALLVRDPFARGLSKSKKFIFSYITKLFSGTAVYVGADSFSPIMLGVWNDVYDWTEKDNSGFGILFHPQIGDFGNYYSPHADNKWVSADLFIDDDPFELDYDFSNGYLWLLSQGWHVGASASNRNLAEWGSKKVRTGVWASKLSKNGIVEAFRTHRTFATQAPDLNLMMQVNGFTMGQVITVNNSKAALTVNASDPKLEISELELYEGDYGTGQLAQIIQGIELNESQVNWTYTINNFQGQKYFLVKLIMSDGAKAWSSPIWIQNAK
jgi:hypothetical protein